MATLSFSDYFYIEGMTCCDISNWIRVNNNAISYFGRITQTVTPDNCKVAVTENKDWINPSVNKDFQAWAEHNGTVIMPAKVRKPRWKPNVEGHVKIVTMHILVEMEEMTFYSLDELNAELWKRMEQENRENFQGLSYSRRDLFESEEKDALLPLPDTQYEYLERKSVKFGPDFSFTLVAHDRLFAMANTPKGAVLPLCHEIMRDGGSCQEHRGIMFCIRPLTPPNDRWTPHQWPLGPAECSS